MNKIIIVFGVSGCGKSTIGKALSVKTGIPFFDADDFHPVANVKKMESGTPLNDTDRAPWLLELNNLLKVQAQNDGAILACSALKESYRLLLAKDLEFPPKWCLLAGDFDLIWNRMKERSDHYMPASLLQSQFDTLEIPDYGLQFDIAEKVADIVDDILLIG